MILSFKPQFVDSILDGTKIHTIREDSKDRWHTGRFIHFATGVRTKNHHQFKSGRCEGIQRISMNLSIENGIEINLFNNYGLSRKLSLYDNITLAKNDGFTNYSDFIDWFYPLLKDGVKDFKIIHFTSYRY